MTQDKPQDKNQAVDKFVPNITPPPGMTIEQVKEELSEALALNVLTYTLVDTVNTMFVDMECSLGKLGLYMKKSERMKFNQLKQAAKKAKYWSNECAYNLNIDVDSGKLQNDSDFWYNLIKLIQDRLGDDERKFRLLIEFLDTMPSEGLFKIGIQDFLKNETD